MRVTVTMALVLMASGCTTGGYTPFPSELLDGITKSGQVGRALVRQRAAEMAGGQAVLGRPGTTGGRGHFAVDVRGSAVSRHTPDVTATSITVAGSMLPEPPTARSGGTTVAASAALGVWSGVPVGTTRMFGADLLLGGTLFTAPASEALTVKSPNSTVGFRYGLRLGVIEETDRLPAVAVSWQRHHGPALSYRWSETPSDNDRMMYLSGRGEIDMAGWRVDAGKRFSRLGVVTGMGRDLYEAGITTTATQSNGPSRDSYTAGEGIIWSWYGGVSYTLGGVMLVGELRHQRDRSRYSSEDAIGRTHLTIGMAVGR